MARVLIVEDEDSLRETLSRYLAHEGHEVIAAASGQEALDAGFDASPDVLIADWMLKNHIHGLHVSEVFRALHPRLNTILITGFPSRDLLEESDRCGVSRLLEKPFDLQELRDAVMNVLAEAPGDPVVAPAGPSIAALSVDAGGALQFASERATELLAAVGAPPGAAHLDEILAGEPPDVLEAAEREWVPVQSRHDPRQEWLLRSRRRPGRVGWLVVLCLRDEEQRRSDPRMRILLDERGGASGRSLEDPAPVVVIERDGVVRRLLVSQIERLGAICYPSDDLA
ncbi:MAG TPA: response regulator, partial [Myxococcota bacterium]|nr:response regulator [Myxococcota bacterium]